MRILDGEVREMLQKLSCSEKVEEISIGNGNSQLLTEY